MKIDFTKYIQEFNNDEDKWVLIREIRSSLLSNSDWTQVNDSPLSDEKKENWKKYRQELRDVTIKYKSPNDVEFPNVTE